MPVAGDLDNEFARRVREKRREHNAKNHVKRQMALNSLVSAELRLKARFNRMNKRINEQKTFTGLDEVSVVDVAPRTYLAKKRGGSGGSGGGGGKGGAIPMESRTPSTIKKQKNFFSIQLNKKRDDNLIKLINDAVPQPPPTPQRRRKKQSDNDYDADDDEDGDDAYNEQRQEDDEDRASVRGAGASVGAGEIRKANSDYEIRKREDDESGVLRLHVRSRSNDEADYRKGVPNCGFCFGNAELDMIGTKRQLVLEEGIYSYTSDIDQHRTMTSWTTGDPYEGGQRSPFSLSPNSSCELEEDDYRKSPRQQRNDDETNENGTSVVGDNYTVYTVHSYDTETADYLSSVDWATRTTAEKQTVVIKPVEKQQPRRFFCWCGS